MDGYLIARNGEQIACFDTAASLLIAQPGNFFGQLCILDCISPQSP